MEGKLRTRKWTDRDGKERYTTEIQVDNLQLLGRRPDREGDGQGGYSGQGGQGGYAGPGYGGQQPSAPRPQQTWQQPAPQPAPHPSTPYQAPAPQAQPAADAGSEDDLPF